MKTEKTYPKYWLFLLLAAAAALILLLFFGPARAHFEAAYSGDITLKYDGNVNQVYLLSANRDQDGELITNDAGYVSEELSWVALQNEQGEEGVGRYSVTFLLANTNKATVLAAQPQTAKLELVATVGIGSPTALEVTLVNGGNSYTAVPTEITEGSTWYNEFGPGWVYRFYNTAGEELSWNLRGGVFAYHEMTLIVSGDNNNDAALPLLATAEISE